MTLLRRLIGLNQRALCIVAGIVSLQLYAADDTQSVGSATASTQDEKTQSVEFVWNPPGKLISVGSHRLHIYCRGSGPVTVLFESGLGGTSLEWLSIQEQISPRARACAYDRGGYAWSDPARGRRDARILGHEAHVLLNNLNIRGPMILVGHSFGGFVIRELANRRLHNIVGLILVDASHEKQIIEFEKIMPIANMPRGGSFVISPIAVPDHLDSRLSFKVATFGRMRKTYAAVHGEMEYFRDSAHQVAELPRPVSYPVVVLRRGRDPYDEDDRGSEKSALWQKLQLELAGLSTRGSLEVASESGHHIHIDEPDRLIRNVHKLLDRYERESNQVAGDKL